MDSVVGKIQKHVDTLKSKNLKQTEEIAKLKAQLTATKQLHSRIRRIAKPDAEPAVPETPAA